MLKAFKFLNLSSCIGLRLTNFRNLPFESSYIYHTLLNGICFETTSGSDFGEQKFAATMYRNELGIWKVSLAAGYKIENVFCFASPQFFHIWNKIYNASSTRKIVLPR